MNTIAETTIEADPKVPVIRMTRDFTAHARAVVPGAHRSRAVRAVDRAERPADARDEWDARSGGSWRYVSTRDGEEYAFRGCFHEVRPDRIVQTFTYEGQPDGVALETLWFEDLGNGRTRLRTQSLVDSFEAATHGSRSGMEVGVNEGYAKLGEMLANGTV